MRKYFEKLFYWNEFINFCSGEKVYYVGNKSSEPRADNDSKISDLKEICTCIEYLLEYDYDKDKLDRKSVV